MGQNLAAVTIATIVEKQSKRPNEIAKSGGYFRAMTERYQAPYAIAVRVRLL